MPHFIPPSSGNFLGFTSNSYKKNNPSQRQKEDSKEGFVRKRLKAFHRLSLTLNPTFPKGPLPPLKREV